MERIKRFFKEERGDAYITSIVVCVAVIAIVLAGVYGTFFSDGISGFFSTVQTKFETWAGQIPDTLPVNSGGSGS